MTVATATSLQSLDRKEAGDASLFALGNPDGSLKEAETEVKALQGLFPGAVVRTGAEATAGSLRDGAPGKRFVHLATHGVLDSRDPASSYLVVAGGGGRVTLQEVYRLPLQGARLVTLSACETAMGSQHPGSEVTSLATAFDVAGSRAVLASLWKVDDLSTRDLMTSFYTGIRKGLGLAPALQEAQVQMLRESEARSSPYHWAPFVLIGDWR